jgi:hypothetical protein
VQGRVADDAQRHGRAHEAEAGLPASKEPGGTKARPGGPSSAGPCRHAAMGRRRVGLEGRAGRSLDLLCNEFTRAFHLSYSFMGTRLSALCSLDPVHTLAPSRRWMSLSHWLWERVGLGDRELTVSKCVIQVGTYLGAGY